jgi:hypothetical protein
MTSHARSAVLGPWQARFLLRLAARIVPEVADAPADVRYRLVTTVDEALALQAPGQQRMFKLLLFALQWMTLPFTLHRLEQLPPRWQDGLLRFLQDGPVRLLRVGIWGVKTLVFMGYYGQDAVERKIQYHPSKTEGNDKLHRLQPQG